MFYTNYERYCNMIGEEPYAVAQKCGISSTGTLTGWRNGAKPRARIVNNIVAYFNRAGVKCTVAELFADYDDDTVIPTIPRWLQIIREKYSSLDAHGKTVVDYVLNEEFDRCMSEEQETERIFIRHYLYSPAAGVNGLVSGEDYEDIPLPHDAPNGADYCLTVSGDSMSPYINDGDLVFVKEDEPLQAFDVGVFCVDGATYVKQYCPSYNGALYLLSANPLRADANVVIKKDSTSSLICFGKVLLKRKLPQPVYDM